MVLHLLVFQTPTGTIIPVLEKAVAGGREEQPPDQETRWAQLRQEVRGVYNKLQDRLDHGERVCTQLRRAEGIRVVYSPTSTPREIEKKLRRFWEVSYSKHTRWLAIDGFLSLLGGVLMPLPGPNVFFFYPAARTLGHYLARSGARTASLSKLEFCSEPLVGSVERALADLDQVGGELASLEEKYNVEKLNPLLFRLSRHESRSE